MDEWMGEVESGAVNLARVSFSCRLRPLSKYLRLRCQGALPLPKGLNFIEGFISWASAILETVVLAGLPPVLVMFVIAVVLRVKVDLFWGRFVLGGMLALSVPFAFWCFWISPRSDILTVSDGGFHWRISLARWGWFRRQGSMAFADLRGFSYRSDWSEPTAVEPGPTTNEKLGRLCLEVNLSRHDLLIYPKNGKAIEIQNVFARFDQNDLEGFMNHLARVAEPCQIPVRA